MATNRTARSAFGMCSILGGLALPLGCTGADYVEETIEVDTTGSELAASTADNWAKQNYVVNLCFTMTGFETEKQWVREAISETWDRYSGLSFVWTSGTCPKKSDGSIDAKYLPVYIRASVGAGDSGGACSGYGARAPGSDQTCGGGSSLPCQCWFADSRFENDPERSLKSTAIHEVGHGLNIHHEHQRPDRPDDIKDWCLDKRPEADWTTHDQYVVIPDMKLLTPPDIKGSIMSYCRDWEQNNVDDRISYPELSPMDKLGIEIMYPFSFSRNAVLSGIGNADGSAYIVRSDVPTTLNIDWISRGAHSEAVESAQWYRKTSSGKVRFSRSQTTTKTVTSTTSYRVDITDTFGRSHTGAWTMAIPDNALHTAVIMAATNI